MGAKKIKVSPKGTKVLEKKEKIESASERINLWLERHYLLIVGAMAAALLIPLIIWGVNTYSKSKERRASAAYAQVIRGWADEERENSTQLEKLVLELEEYVKEYEGTSSAVNARLDLARALFELKRYEDAARRANQVIDGMPAGSALKSLARYQLALTYEAMGESDQALNQWLALKGEGLSGAEREIEWHLARLYAGKGDYSKAGEHYDLALKASGDYPNTALLQSEKASVATGEKAGS